MPKTLVDVDSFDIDVSIPTDGDSRNSASVESAFQKLVNRSRNSKNRLDNHEQYACYAISGTVANGAQLTLTERDKNGSFVLASNQVQVPAAGTYEVSVTSICSGTDTTNPVALGLVLNKGTNIEQAKNYRFSATAAQLVQASVVSTVVIADPATEKLLLLSSISTATGTLTANSASRLFIRRIK